MGWAWLRDQGIHLLPRNISAENKNMSRRSSPNHLLFWVKFPLATTQTLNPQPKQIWLTDVKMRVLTGVTAFLHIREHAVNICFAWFHHFPGFGWLTEVSHLLLRRTSLKPERLPDSLAFRPLPTHSSVVRSMVGVWLGSIQHLSLLLFSQL